MCGCTIYASSEPSSFSRELQEQIRRENEALERARRKAIVDNAVTVSKEAEVLSRSSDAADVRSFLHGLSSYLSERSKKTFWGDWDYASITERTNKIKECVTAIGKSDPVRISNCLKEEKIRPYNGYFFADEMYTVMKKFQDYPGKRQAAVAKEVPVPMDVIKLINEYEAILHHTDPAIEENNGPSL